MARKRNNLFLYLALVCFLGIILIFIFDGYIGVYDRLVMDNNQFIQTIENDQWARTDRFSGLFSISMERGGRIDFTYTVENHRFSEYAEEVGVSLWYNKEKTSDLLTRQLSIPAFNKEEITWSVSAVDIVPAGYPAEQNYFINIKINRGNIEREVNINIYATPTVIKTVPVPAP